MGSAEKVAAAGELKAKGNAAFKAGHWDRAVRKYERAVDYVQ